MLQLCTMLEKEMLLWKSFISLENIFRVESGRKIHFPRFKTQVPMPVSDQNPKRGSFTVVTSLMAIDEHQLRGRRT